MMLKNKYAPDELNAVRGIARMDLELAIYRFTSARLSLVNLSNDLSLQAREESLAQKRYQLIREMKRNTDLINTRVKSCYYIGKKKKAA